MNIVVVGHVDHGKSTVIGRLFADTGSLPQGKLEQVKASCERNARPFEYAFLLDALKDEQAQGITIDTARCFFKTEKRDYIIIDAPGHVEFLKNMVSGAARAEAALLVIDAHEGIMENSKRHGYLVSMLGIRQIVVLVNKMDLIGFDKTRYDAVIREYRVFLEKLGATPTAFVPICARDGDNIAGGSSHMPWYAGDTVLAIIDALKKKSEDRQKPFRMPVQDIYKFTGENDDRRIFAGTIETGSIAVGDGVVFLPSGKQSVIATIEGFNVQKQESACTGQATGFTIRDELYIKRGDLMCRENEPLPIVASRFHANVFWMGKRPLVKDKKYRLKIGAARQTVRLLEVVSCIDAADLGSIAGKQQMDRHDVAECIFETVKPIAFDTIDSIEATARFVIVDNYDIAGGGIIIKPADENNSWLGDLVRQREHEWDKGDVSSADRAGHYGHKSKFIALTGIPKGAVIARALERSLLASGFATYYLGIKNISIGVEAENTEVNDTAELYFKLGEIARILTDAGLIFIAAIGESDADDRKALRKLSEPHEVLIVSVGLDDADRVESDLHLNQRADIGQCVQMIVDRLKGESIIPDYVI